MPHPNDIKAAKEVLRLEIAGIQALSDSINEEFSEALDMMTSIKGRVIITGMGKSGHIGKKIAATLASTGTPSFFVHPAEASHGDLGMITTNDVVVAISNSGESSELGDIVTYCKRFGIALIAIVSRKDSTLGKAATKIIALPRSGEACPLGLAPTTSTTVTLALGDAIAIALLERKGFTKDDFKARHPGGKLGNILATVKDLMHIGEELPLVSQGTNMEDALIIMTEKSFGCVGVVDAKGQLIGIITDGDLRRKMSSDLLSLTVDSVMSINPKTIRAETLIAEAVQFLNAKKITSLFVVEEDVPVGILHIHDCLRAGVA